MKSTSKALHELDDIDRCNSKNKTVDWLAKALGSRFRDGFIERPRSIRREQNRPVKNLRRHMGHPLGIRVEKVFRCLFRDERCKDVFARSGTLARIEHSQNAKDVAIDLELRGHCHARANGALPRGAHIRVHGHVAVQIKARRMLAGIAANRNLDQSPANGVAQREARALRLDVNLRGRAHCRHRFLEARIHSVYVVFWPRGGIETERRAHVCTPNSLQVEETRAAHAQIESARSLLEFMRSIVPKERHDGLEDAGRQDLMATIVDRAQRLASDDKKKKERQMLCTMREH